MDKKELLKQVDDIYRILSAFSVNGDAVDVVAQMRAMLRNLRTGIAKLPEMGAKEAVNDG